MLHFSLSSRRGLKAGLAAILADPGRFWLAGTEARPTEQFSYKVAIKGRVIIVAHLRVHNQERADT
jgi:hypothetical protein